MLNQLDRHFDPSSGQVDAFGKQPILPQNWPSEHVHILSMYLTEASLHAGRGWGPKEMNNMYFENMKTLQYKLSRNVFEENTGDESMSKMLCF